jgi:CRP-like cAMP-binding protein
VGGDRAEALRRISLFADLDPRELECVGEATKELDVPAGQVLIQPGAKGTGMFFIDEGTVVVETKRDHVELGPGEFFGELALMTTDETRTARVRAKTPLRCLTLDRAGFRELVSTYPEVGASLLEAALNRLAQNAAPRG